MKYLVVLPTIILSAYTLLILGGVAVTPTTHAESHAGSDTIRAVNSTPRPTPKNPYCTANIVPSKQSPVTFANAKKKGLTVAVIEAKKVDAEVLAAATKQEAEEKITPTPTKKPTPSTEPSPTTPTSLTSPTSVPTPTTQSPPTEAPAGSLSADVLFNMINSTRAANGLPALEKHPDVCSLAASRGPELYNEIFGSSSIHAGFNARNLPYWATENMIHQDTEEAAFNWWMNSSLHRSAILGNHKYACGTCVGKSCAMIFTSFQPK